MREPLQQESPYFLNLCRDLPEAAVQNQLFTFLSLKLPTSDQLPQSSSYFFSTSLTIVFRDYIVKYESEPCEEDEAYL